MENGKNKIFSLLAGLFEYPSADTADQAREAAAALDTIHPAAGRHLAGFAAYCKTNDVRTLEELYTETFDLQAKCPPYVGHHLFGEDRVRGMFMARLKEHYRDRISCGNELPDHIALMLRSLGIKEADEETRDLKEYCIVPAVRKMVGLLEKDHNPYKSVLNAVLLTLQTGMDE